MCVFCSLDPSRILLDNGHGVVIRDGYPVTELHSLIIPKRHVGSFFDLVPQERADLLTLLDETRTHLLQQDPSIKSFNIGINDGKEAGQTIPHCHIHLIPRRAGDMLDPKGGVRGVIPEKQKY